MRQALIKCQKPCYTTGTLDYEQMNRQNFLLSDYIWPNNIHELAIWLIFCRLKYIYSDITKNVFAT